MKWFCTALLLACQLALGQAEVSRQVVLEASRQEMIAALADDLRSNPGATDTVAQITTLQNRLTTLSDQTLAGARTSLAKAAQDPANASAQLAIARGSIDRAARELASLLLQAGVAPAADVLARELRDIVDTPTPGATADRLAKLLSELDVRVTEDDEALTAVRIARVRKQIEAAKAVERLRSAESLEQGMQTLRQAEAKLKPTVTLAMLVRARETLQTAQAALAGLADQPSEVAQRRRAAIATTVQPLAQLTELSMLAAIEPDALDARLTQAHAIVQQQIEKIERLPAAYQQMSAINSRTKTVETFVARQSDLIEAAYAASEAKQPLVGVADAQQRLGRDITLAAGSMTGDQTWLKTLRLQLGEAGVTLNRTSDALRTAPFAESSALQAANLKALEEILATIQREQAFLEKGWSLLQLAGNLRDFAESVRDIEAEQRDLRTGLSDKADATTLVRHQELLTKAIAETRLSIELVPEASVMRPPLAEAERLMTESREKLSTGDLPAAAALHEKAEQALRQAHQFATETAARADYLADWARQMQQASAGAGDLLQRQIAIRKRTEPTDAAMPPLAPEEDVLRSEATAYAGLSFATAADAFKAAATEMGKAAESLRAADRAKSVGHQIEAEKQLRTAALELQKILAGMEPAPAEAVAGLDPGMDALTALLLLAVEEKELTDATRLAPPREIAPLADRQAKLHAATLQLVGSPGMTKFPALAAVIPTIRQGATQMQQASTPLKESRRDPAIEHEQLAERHLRTAFAQAIVAIYNAQNAPPPPPATAAPGAAEGLPMDAYESWTTFMRVQPGGAEVNRDKAEWESLIERQRSALHENFARELPLEYREMLKDYYQALSK